jgi:uncharacterized protein
MALADETYVSLTTYRRDGTPVTTPVWWVDLGDGKFGFWTSSVTGKVKRLNHTERVTVQPSNARGVVKPGTEAVEATARVVTGTELDLIKQRVVAKYGFQTKITKLVAKLTAATKGKRLPYADCGVVVTVP